MSTEMVTARPGCIDESDFAAAARLQRALLPPSPLAQSTVSEHLRILKEAGLVRANEDGLRVTYCIVPAALTRFNALPGAV